MNITRRVGRARCSHTAGPPEIPALATFVRESITAVLVLARNDEKPCTGGPSRLRPGIPRVLLQGHQNGNSFSKETGNGQPHGGIFGVTDFEERLDCLSS